MPLMTVLAMFASYFSSARLEDSVFGGPSKFNRRFSHTSQAKTSRRSLCGFLNSAHKGSTSRQEPR